MFTDFLSHKFLYWGNIFTVFIKKIYVIFCIFTLLFFDNKQINLLVWFSDSSRSLPHTASSPSRAGKHKEKFRPTETIWKSDKLDIYLIVLDYVIYIYSIIFEYGSN